MNASFYSILRSKVKMSLFCLNGQPTTRLISEYVRFIGAVMALPLISYDCIKTLYVLSELFNYQ